MKLETYTLKSDADKTIFEFISQGSKGNIHKLVFFQKKEIPEFYNLHPMKTIEKKSSKTLEIKINPKLEKYKDSILFPEKLEKANLVLKAAILPKSKHEN